MSKVVFSKIQEFLGMYINLFKYSNDEFFKDIFESMKLRGLCQDEEVVRKDTPSSHLLIVNVGTLAYKNFVMEK